MKVNKPKVFVTDGRDVPLNGMCLLFTRPKPEKAITEQNITQVCVKIKSIVSNLISEGDNLDVI